MTKLRLGNLHLNEGADVPWYQKPVRGYIRMFRGTKNQNEGTFAKTTLLRNRPFVASRSSSMLHYIFQDLEGCRRRIALHNLKGPCGTYLSALKGGVALQVASCKVSRYFQLSRDNLCFLDISQVRGRWALETPRVMKKGIRSGTPFTGTLSPISFEALYRT